MANENKKRKKSNTTTAAAKSNNCNKHKKSKPNNHNEHKTSGSNNNNNSMLTPKVTKNTKSKRNGSISTTTTTAMSDDENQQTFSSCVSNNNNNSLAAKLKRLRGTAETTPPPPEFKVSTKQVLGPKDGDLFQDCLTTSFQGFTWDLPKESDFHLQFQQTFVDLEGLYLRDAIQPGGNNAISFTFCQRTLVGNPGSTYRYLGLRLFSHPWQGVINHQETEVGDAMPITAPESNHYQSLQQLGYSSQHAKALYQMGLLNQMLRNKTCQKLETIASQIDPPGLVGSADFTLTLVNRMEHSGSHYNNDNEQQSTLLRNKKKKKKATATGKHDDLLGQTTVSWHKDSGLMDFSSIAVYHTLLPTTTTTNAGQGRDWSIALRSAHYKTQQTPTLCIPFPSGTIYYMLDDFNHQHEHAVVTGNDCLRYSSTHRVARAGCGTWQYIRNQCLLCLQRQQEAIEAISKNNNNNLISPKTIRNHQQTMIELEFEWLRQWYVQGQQHADLHAYWHGPIQRMETWFQSLDSFLFQVLLQHVREKTTGGNNNKSKNNNLEAILDVLIESTQERQRLCNIWDKRLENPFYAKLKHRPMDVPSFLSSAPKLKELMVQLRTLKKKLSGQSKTKKEKRNIASNWQSLQRQMSKKTRK